MSTQKLTNISLKEYRRFLSLCGCTCHRTKGGHEMWAKPGLARPVTFSNHVDPIWELVIKNGLKSLGLSKEQFFAMLK